MFYTKLSSRIFAISPITVTKSLNLINGSQINSTESRNIATTIDTRKNCFELLTNRRLIRLSGSDTCDLLQGLITNDVRHLERATSMFAMFLNVKGRVLYDAIFYRENFANYDTILIECDDEARAPLIRHLKMYTLRKRVKIDEYDDHEIGVIYDRDFAKRSNLIAKKLEIVDDDIDGHVLPCGSGNTAQNFVTIDDDVIVQNDPRLSNYCVRILARKNCNLIGKLAKFYGDDLAFNCDESYRWFRYSLGIGEGVADFPVGNCFPLEANCDYLHGVSFHKGCYIGQELTARTYHTGVIRKRYMPLYFKSVPTKLPEDLTIAQHDGKRLGKLRGSCRDVGLALLRVNDAINCDEIAIGKDGVAYTARPIWWPKEVGKEKLANANSNEGK